MKGEFAPNWLGTIPPKWYLDTRLVRELVMRAHVHDTAMQFKVNTALLARAREVAEREGMGLAEFVRQAVREKVREAA